MEEVSIIPPIDIWERYTKLIEGVEGKSQQSVNVKAIILELDYRLKMAEECLRAIAMEEESKEKARTAITHTTPQIILPNG